ncbi:hypothetical protein ARMGADRAFT_574936 [Armillaria gallica]|uniref:Uncharacterized protein n=1 Tax=Armillaria gallica TaxID=47427 RepID=A0A2H3ED20_ARMGA|nr:hypothetical protein ARMGADRAFT_574936 [Armillaria gallica]
MARERLSGACRLFLRVTWADLVTGVAGWTEAVVNTSSSRRPKNKVDTILQVISLLSSNNYRSRFISQRRCMQLPLNRFSFEYGNGNVSGNGVIGSPGGAKVDMLVSIQALKNPNGGREC